jgi:Ni/Co efflux regulator RcnB
LLLVFKTFESMNKLLISLLSAAALGLPLTSGAQAPAMPAAPVAQPEQATAPAATYTETAASKKAAKKHKKKKLKKKKSKKAKAH